VRLDQLAEPVVRIEVRKTDDINHDLVAALVAVEEVPLKERIDREAGPVLRVVDRHHDDFRAELGLPTHRAVKRVDAKEQA